MMTNYTELSLYDRVVSAAQYFIVRVNFTSAVTIDGAWQIFIETQIRVQSSETREKLGLEERPGLSLACRLTSELRTDLGCGILIFISHQFGNISADN